jgi:mycothiol synthase
VDTVQLRRPVAPGDVKVLRDLVDVAERHAGHPVVGDAVWLDLADPSPDTALLVASDDTGPVGAMHLGPSDSVATPHTRLSFAVSPDVDAAAVIGRLATAALDDVRARGGGPVELWVLGADDACDAVLNPIGLHRSRELWQLRVPLPAAPPTWPAGVEVVPFEPGRDEAAWLATNNRAFAADPDQGGWTATALRRREAEPWFDPHGFLLARDDDGIAGFCWTKLHPAAPPVEPDPLGEIYVIGVDPPRQGSGLGRALVLGGLADLHDRQRAPVGMLFVDAANTAAVALYESLGFTLARVDRAYAARC